ncbi:MAG: hypothetical protein EA392_10670 [Cryomorphaceae bacterium]|nr:MAG: hypothetical protein EA392_10670 [Cryomorphaceae bacterium]
MLLHPVNLFSQQSDAESDPIADANMARRAGDFKSSIAILENALKAIDNKTTDLYIVDLQLELAMSYHYANHYSKALGALLEAETVLQTLNAPAHTGQMHNHIGSLFQTFGELDKAALRYQLALQSFREINHEKNQAQCFNNLAVLALDGENPQLALAYLDSSMVLWQSLGEKHWQALTSIHRGSAYLQQNAPERALQHFETARLFFREHKDDISYSILLCKLGETESALGNHQNALKLCEEGLGVAQRVGFLRIQRDCCNCLYNSNVFLGNSKRALNYITLELMLRDSIQSEEKAKEVVRLEMSHAFRQKLVTDSLAFVQQIEIEKSEVARQDAELRARRNQQYGLSGGLFLAVIFAGVVYNRYRIIERQKEIIERQKKLVDDRNAMVTESIQYARRLQRAILPQQSQFEELFPKSFLIYRPRDIVAGDFFWVHQSGNTVLFAVADCTGHGVPAAMVSVICCNALKQSIHQFPEANPAQLLNMVREAVIQTFAQSEREMNEGMDISLCALNGNQLLWAGSNRPLYVFRGDQFIEFKGDRQPVGNAPIQQPYGLHQHEVQPGDRIYLFSDGFSDQFGGEYGKKFKTAHFKAMLLEIQSQSMSAQAVHMNRVFDEWKGSRSQLDDVCVMGVEVG